MSPVASAPTSAYVLTPKQGVAMDALIVDEVNQLLYGGAAGGGKSGFLRASAYHDSQVYPGARIAIFRENYTQLKKTQVTRWWAEMTRLGWEIKRQWLETAGEWHFPNPYSANPSEKAEDTIVEFLHLDASIGAEKWLSAEWAAIYIDESTQMSEEDLALLYSRVRVETCKECDDAERDFDSKRAFCPVHAEAELKYVPLKIRWRRLANMREDAARAQGITDPLELKRIRSDWHPKAVYATNPGGASHDYHKRDFVDVQATHHDEQGNLTYWDTATTVLLPGVGEVDVPTRRRFIQSYLTDNPHIDPLQYAATLAHLSKRRREQMLSGNWDYFEGQVFNMLDKEIHLVDAKWVFNGRPVPPDDWPRHGGMDHGTQAPTCFLWQTMDEDGNFIVGYQEYYAPGPNRQHIQAVRALLMLDGRYDLVFEADPQMWRKRQGHDRVWATADEFTYGGEPPDNAYDAQVAKASGIKLRPSSVERIAARMVLERLFETDDNRPFPAWHPKYGEYGAPRAYICQQAPNLWRELINLKYVDGSEDTVKVDDHAVDAAFRVMPVFEQAVYRQQRSPIRTIGYAGQGAPRR